MTAPEPTAAAPADPDLEHRRARIRELGERGLRVIVAGRRTPAARGHPMLRAQEDPPVKLKVDQQADALYLTLSDAPAHRSEEVSPGIIVDCDAQDRGVGIELLSLSKRAPQTDIRRRSFESVPDVA